MAFHSIPYKNATKIANHLALMILKTSQPSMALSALVNQWRELEQTKRDWRGLPRLAPATMTELMNVKRTRMKQLPNDRITIIETPEPDDHEPSSQTVPTPPDPEAPTGEPVDYNK